MPHLCNWHEENDNDDGLDSENSLDSSNEILKYNSTQYSAPETRAGLKPAR
jgi:hypothetical protein